MTIHSVFHADTYLHNLRQAFGSPTDFGLERFTGICFGRFFCVTHHCSSYDWEKRFRYQKNTAIGIVNNTDNGCNIHFFTTKGDLRPQWLIPVYLILTVISVIFTQTFLFALHFGGIFTLAAILSAIIEPFTDGSKDGYKSLLSLLKNPNNPYENL